MGRAGGGEAGGLPQTVGAGGGALEDSTYIAMSYIEEGEDKRGRTGRKERLLLLPGPGGGRRRGRGETVKDGEGWGEALFRI